MSIKVDNKICIVGAGPAGVVTSIFLAKAGIPSVLVDKSTFPRQKPCADCITGNVLRILNKINPNIITNLEKTGDLTAINGINAYADNNNRIKFDFLPLEPNTELPSCYTIQREHFDALLIKEAKATGLVEFKENFTVSNVVFDVDAVKITSKNSQTLYAKCLVDASGSNSKLRNQVFNTSDKNEHTAIGIRAYFKHVDIVSNDFCELYLSRKLMPGGMYVSPMPHDVYNVNMVVRLDKKQKHDIDLKQAFNHFLESNELVKQKFKNAVPIRNFEGSRLRLGTKKRKIHGNNYIAVGDAAGLIDILSANGIPQAFMSAEIAAEHLIACIKANDFSADRLKKYEQHVFKRTKNYLRLGRLSAPFMKSEFVLDFVNFGLNAFSAQIEKSSLMNNLVYGKKKPIFSINPAFYKRFFFGMKN